MKLPAPFNLAWRAMQAAAKDKPDDAKAEPKAPAPKVPKAAGSKGGPKSEFEEIILEGSGGPASGGLVVIAASVSTGAGENTSAGLAKKEPPKVMTITSATRFASQSERHQHEEKLKEQRNQRQAAKLRKEQQIRVHLLMSEATRLFVEDVLRAMSALPTPTQCTNASDFALDTIVPQPVYSGGSADWIDSEDAAQLLKRLILELQFSPEHAQAAARAVGRQPAAGPEVRLQQATDWLVLHVPEDKLPKAFDPRMYQVVQVADDPAVLTALRALLSPIDQALPPAAFSWALKKVGASTSGLTNYHRPSAAATCLFRELYREAYTRAGFAGLLETRASVDEQGAGASEATTVCIDEEGPTLQAIYERDYRPVTWSLVRAFGAGAGSGTAVGSEDDGGDERSIIRSEVTGWTVPVPGWVGARTGDAAGDMPALQVLVLGSAYPHELPVFVLRGDRHLPPAARLALTLQLATHLLQEAALGSPMTHVALEFLSTHWPKGGKSAGVASPYPLPVAWSGKAQRRGLSDAQAAALRRTAEQAERLTDPSISTQPHPPSGERKGRRGQKKAAESQAAVPGQRNPSQANDVVHASDSRGRDPRSEKQRDASIAAEHEHVCEPEPPQTAGPENFPHRSSQGKEKKSRAPTPQQWEQHKSQQE